VCGRSSSRRAFRNVRTSPCPAPGGPRSFASLIHWAFPPPPRAARLPRAAAPHRFAGGASRLRAPGAPERPPWPASPAGGHKFSPSRPHKACQAPAARVESPRRTYLFPTPSNHPHQTQFRVASAAVLDETLEISTNKTALDARPRLGACRTALLWGPPRCLSRGV
jgi:hypothetical protein